MPATIYELPVMLGFITVEYFTFSIWYLPTLIIIV